MDSWIGNFIDQEILGKPTEMPWGVVFLHPADGGPIVPRHPAQLYESVTYFAIFFLLFWLFKTKAYFQKEGKISGLFLLLIFRITVHFGVFQRREQSVLVSPQFSLTMGQMLSIPLVIWGAVLLLRKKRGEKGS